MNMNELRQKAKKLKCEMVKRRILALKNYYKYKEGKKDEKCQKCNIWIINRSIKNGKICKYCLRKMKLEIEALRNSKHKYGNGVILFEDIFKNTNIEYHHISDGFIIILPIKIHKKYKKDLYKSHRDKLKPIIEELYNISYIIVEE
jgi:hypothetical protein